MTPLADELRREVRVALSPKAQPIGLRVVKWMVFGGVTAYLWGTPGVWIWILFVLGAGLGVHLLWRHKTKGWKEPWAGWDDVDTAWGRKESSETEWKTEL